ncbi:MAG: HAMP domain-containing histidine kinase [Bacteroidia bacterium]|nr:HAMP domain-containing histidine kinase [Bacteroidia bacterium]
MALAILSRILADMGKHRFEQKLFLTIHIALSAPLILVAYFLYNENGFLLICFTLFGFIWPFILLFPLRVQFRHMIGFALLCASFLSVQFEQLNSFKEKEHRKIFAAKLIAKQDIDNEIKLLNIEKEMVSSSSIDSFFYYSGNDYDEIELNYKFTFFNDFIKNFDIDIMRYDSFGHDINPNKLTYSYVNILFNKSNNKTISNYFLFIKDLHYLGGYLAKFEICPGKRNIGYVFVMLTPKVKSDLYNLDYFFSKIDYNQLTENSYSYAIYQKNELVKGLGAYPFKLSDHIQYTTMEDVSFYEENGYSQLFKKIDDETFVIVSLKAATWNKKFTVFTFLLLYLSGILFIIYVALYCLVFILGLLTFNPFFLKLFGVVTRYLRVININKLYLETKIRLSFLMISILVCSVVIYFTVQNVNRSFREKQNESLDKKMSQIVSEIEMGYQKKDQRPMQNMIKHLAGNHEVDINIYTKDGTLYQTANNRIYFEGWFSPYMNPNAQFELIQNRQYSIKQIERIGQLEYLSYYTSLFDENRNLFGYVHLPYFSKSLDLKNEFSNYLGSLLNISTLLLMISLLIASYIGRSLVRPLKLMIDNLARIKVGEQNTSIAWTRNDEIGQLVDQYNIMLKKLEVSTELLAQSEREGAWKEMAKQVAHEIKNPLTPMKLHLQHLQMSINRDDVNLKEKVNNVSRILIEQIDQLSRMAEEFSSFAKMPMAVLETCDIGQVLESCIILFKAQNELEIQFETRVDGIQVYIDKGQMQRVFTNILKNALQAARENENCKIIVSMQHIQDQIIISFEDNGKGIEDDLKDKIFHPSFSTKNSGMGLGLSICKKIVEQVHGTITFDSDVNKGTTFFVILPIITPETSIT